MEAGGRETLTLRIIPRRNRPFDLAVKWSCTPARSQAMIEVQEPKLAMKLEGPRDVLYGQSNVYRLEISNSGNGDAENVLITLAPQGSGDNGPATHKLDDISAGQTKAIEIELTAREVGTLTINVDVRADGGAGAQLAEKILVRRAALEVDVRGPRILYVGTTAGYRIRVSNPGSAPAEKVSVEAMIPPGAEYVSSTADGQAAADNSKVVWTLESLPCGAERVFEVKCTLGVAGASRLDVVSSAEGNVSDSASTVTRVEALADLVLEVTDPTRPVPVGSEAAYELRVENRGSKDAEGVDVVAYFSKGIEPTRAEGRKHTMRPGQVVFETIPTLGAGQQVVLKVNARAEAAGNHIFRAEVYCKVLGSRLVSEETTHFYDGGPLPHAMSGSQTADQSVGLSGDTARAADARPLTGAAPQAGEPTRSPLEKDRPTEPTETPSRKR